MIGITGSSGYLGGRILRSVTSRRPADQPVIAMTRHPDKTPELERVADEVRQADFTEPEGLVRAFRGIDTLLIVSVEGQDEERIRLHRNALEAALACGVRRILYTSFFDVDTNSPSSVARVHRMMEADLMASGSDWVMLRDGPYADNFANRVAEAAKQDGIFRMAAGEARVPFIGRGDLAEAAAAAVLSQRSGVAWRLSGAELLSCADLCAIVSETFGLPVRYQAISDEEQAADLQRQGLRADLIERRVAYGRAIREGYMSALTDDFQNLVGRAPVRIRDLLPSLDLNLEVQAVRTATSKTRTS
ncbi:NAD(P)H-binding protein [Bradyrhizobium sp. 14AA]